MVEVEDSLFEKINSHSMGNMNLSAILNAYISKLHEGNEMNMSLVEEYFQDLRLDNLEKEETDALYQIFGILHMNEVSSKNMDFSSKNMGTFFVRSVLSTSRIDNAMIDDIFTDPQNEVSLPDIASMYNVKNFKMLKLSTPAKFNEVLVECHAFDFYCDGPEIKKERYSGFEECLKMIANMSLTESKYSNWASNTKVQVEHILPCNDLGIENTSLEQYDRVMGTNMRSVYHLTMMAVPHLEVTRGNIVNVSSVNGIRSFPGVLACNVSKGSWTS